MKIPSVGWAFFGLAAVVLIGYLLTIGIYVGKEIKVESEGGGKLKFYPSCRYLYLSGIRSRGTIWFPDDTYDEAAKTFCLPFGNSK